MKINVEYLYRLADEYRGHGNPSAPADDLRTLLDALSAAEHRATRAEAQSAIRGRAVVIYRDRARKAEAERDWNIRSSRLAKEERIKANARAEKAEERVAEEKRLRMKATAAATKAEAGLERAWEECAAMAAHHGAFDGSRTRWLSSINPYSITEKEKEA